MILLREDILENLEMTPEQIASLQPALAKLLGQFRHCFARNKTFGYLEKYIQGLLSDVKRKSIEPIALAAGVAVRTLQEFLAFFRWDEDRAAQQLIRLVANEHGRREAIGVLDASGHCKQGDKTPGVQRQWCGESGKIDNCVVGQHLLYTDNDPQNPFGCVLLSDLFLPQEWSEDPDRCEEAGIPEDLRHRPKWRIGIDQVRLAIREGIRFSFLTADEDYGKVPQFWFDLDALGQWAVAEVPKNFLCWPKPPAYRSLRSEYAAKRVDNVVRHSPLFYSQSWKRMQIKEATRGPCVWQVKAGQVHMVDTRNKATAGCSEPTDRTYWLIVAKNKATGEIKYFVSNAPAHVSLQRLLEVAFGRWHIEKWFERAKQEAGFGSFEVRTYRSLMRHWLASRIAMYFLANETQRLRGEKSADHVGAGRGGSEHVGLDSLEPLASLVGLGNGEVQVLSTAKSGLV
jgi:SRSO17 transposase